MAHRIDQGCQAGKYQAVERVTVCEYASVQVISSRHLSFSKKNQLSSSLLPPRTSSQAEALQGHYNMHPVFNTTELEKKKGKSLTGRDERRGPFFFHKEEESIAGTTRS